MSKAKEALDKLKTYADQNSQLELKVATEKAQAAITNVEGQIRALDRIQTESRHQVSTNAEAARAEIMSLNGVNTSSTHTIYVQRVSYTAWHAWTPTIKFNLPGGCLPGSLSIATDGITIFDDAGLLKTASGTMGTIDYANGILSLNSGSMSNAKAITYTPAAQLLRAPQSSEIPVTPESRSQSYVGTVNPVPQPGTLSISYMAQGRWYVLSDGGNGSLKGLDASYGAGTFNRNTGAFVVTLGALPDVGSSGKSSVAS